MADGIQKSPTAGVTATMTSGGDQIVRAQSQQVETAGMALATRAEAMVKARVALAVSRPRDWMQVRERMLKDCERPGFAEKAMYRLKRGDSVINGISIRGAEALARHSGNLVVESPIIAEDATKRLIEVTVTDLETNFTETQQVVVTRTVERKAYKGEIPKGLHPSQILGERLNSYGDRIFIVEATDDEFNIKTNAAVSKVRRNKILEMIPADIRADIEEAAQRVYTKAMAGEYKDPNAWQKKLFDAFATLKVDAAQLRAYVMAAHNVKVEQLTEKQLQEVRDVFNAINQGETTFAREYELVSESIVDTGETVDKKTGEVVKAPDVKPAPKPTPAPAQTVEAPKAAPTSTEPVPREPTDDELAAERAKRSAVAVPEKGTPNFTAWLEARIDEIPAKGEPGFEERCTAVKGLLNDVEPSERSRIVALYGAKRTGKAK